jgi:hypothetical protein
MARKRAKPETFDVEGRTFRKGQKVWLKVPWPNGSVKDMEGTLSSVNGDKAYVETSLGIVEGYADTMDSPE